MPLLWVVLGWFLRGLVAWRIAPVPPRLVSLLFQPCFKLGPALLELALFQLEPTLFCFLFLPYFCSPYGTLHVAVPLGIWATGT